MPVDSFTVTFRDWDYTNIGNVQIVPRGGNATAPSNPVRANHTFIGWDRSFTNVQSDIVVTALYSGALCKVTFKDDNGTIKKEETVPYGGNANAPDMPGRTGYTMAWDKPFDVIYQDTVVTAVYTINTYTVTFKDWDGATLKTQTVNYGSNATETVSKPLKNRHIYGIIT